jgi:hypothetical protein
MPSVVADSTVFMKIDLTAEMFAKWIRIACVKVLNVAKPDSNAGYNMLSLICYRWVSSNIPVHMQSRST